MLRKEKLNDAAYIFCLNAEIEHMLSRKGASIKPEKNTTYYKQSLAFAKEPDSRKEEYLRCASVTASMLADMNREYFRAYSQEYTTYHAPSRRATNSHDGRDLIFTNSDGYSFGVSIGRFPSAQDRPALFFSDNNKIRLLDISDAWFGTGAMSLKYISSMEPYSEFIQNNLGKKWNEVFPDSDTKYSSLYLPLLNLLKHEVEYQCNRGAYAVQSFVRHFFGDEDYYLVSLHPDINRVRISAYDVNGKLAIGEQYSGELLPTELIDIRFKEKAGSVSNTTLHLTFNNGWVMNMRLRTTDSVIRSGPRLEIDFKDSIPYRLFFRECYW